jgi:hypothetical protein
MSQRLSSTSKEFDKKFKAFKREFKRETNIEIKKQLTARFKEERKRYYERNTIEFRIEKAKLDLYSEMEIKFLEIDRNFDLMRLDMLNFKEELLSRMVRIEDKLDGIESLYFIHENKITKHTSQITKLEKTVYKL